MFLDYVLNLGLGEVVGFFFDFRVFCLGSGRNFGGFYVMRRERRGERGRGGKVVFVFSEFGFLVSFLCVLFF